MKSQNNKEEIEKEIEDYLRGKEMKATFQNQEIAKTIFGDLLYNELDVIKGLEIFYEKGSLSKEKEMLKIINELKTRNIEDKGLDVETEDYWIKFEELKQKLKGDEK